jgi:hypothetical protein
MKNKYLHSTGWFPVLSLLVLSACTDSAYDLSDIDTTARFQTEGLVVPINIDYVTLDQVLDLKDNSDISKETDAAGNIFYAVTKNGEFHSDPIYISSFTISKPQIEVQESTLEIEQRPPHGYPGGVTARYPIATEDAPIITSFDAHADNFDSSIKLIEAVGTEARFSITIKITGASMGRLDRRMLEEAYFEDIKIQLPKGLTALSDKGTYNASTGVLDLSGEKIRIQSNGEASVEIVVTAIDATLQNMKIDYGQRTIKYADDLSIIGGEVNVYVDADFPPAVSFTFKPVLSDIVVKTFTGRLEYEVKSFDIAPVKLDNIPDLLNESGTELGIENPQLYLSINNPVDKYGVDFETGFEITSKRTTEETTMEKTYPIDEKIQLTAWPEEDKEHFFVLSPSDPGNGNYLQTFDAVDNHPKWVSYSQMKNILKGVGGVPTIIEVEAVGPKMPEQRVVDFELGDLPAVVGKYTFFAPLQLSDNSSIVYTDTLDGWNDKDVDAITIKKLVLGFNVTTEIPFEIELTAPPIGTDGKPIEGVTVTTARVKALADNQPVEVVIEGNITHLDGLLLKATLVNKGSETVLGPEMKLYLDNTRATITGYYEKEL